VAEKKSGPASGISGAVEGIKGKAKEAVGEITDNDRLADEGRAQQDKAESERDVARRETQAEEARAEAEAHEARQRADQR
jgi:uncharacterized protein YjbJ (UPF0337 family)